MNQSVFGGVTDEHVRVDPYPYIHNTQALEPEYYRKLAAEAPDPRRIFAKRWGENNVGLGMRGLSAMKAGVVPPTWFEFFEYHYSESFYLEVVKFFGDRIRAVHPALEHRIGKPLEKLTVAPRSEGIDADVLLDCQFVINTPVRARSRVRTVHVDNTRKLFNALLYMRCDEDDAEGGDLDLCRFKDGPRFWEVSTPDSMVDVVARVPYRANTLFFMVNSPVALHGVTPRDPNPHYRRYVNFLAELRDPIFDLAPYQDREAMLGLQNA